jgi:hypothetical protein
MKECTLMSEEQGQLMQRTREALAMTDRSYNKIYYDTLIPPNWLSMFASNKIKDPGVNRVEKLYTYLTGRAIWSE